MNPEFPFLTTLTTRKIFSVSELTGQVAELLEAHFGTVFVEGEITNLRIPASGHLYMSIKDSKAQIRGIMFRRQVRLLDFTPENGMTVICRGHLDFYDARGDLQMVIDAMEPSGRGAYRMALERLKKKLSEEGLFDVSRKKPLPILPRVIGVVTSPTGAAIRDILKVIRTRNEKVTILIYPARVQGGQAPEDITEGITFFNRHHLADVLIVGRGGGSAEDLDAFNTERVVRAIAASRIPVISAVGHEIDVTLSDLAADVRAPTPTAAAETVILERGQWLKRMNELQNRLIQGFQLLVEQKKSRLRGLESRLVDPRHQASLIRLKLDEYLARLTRHVSQGLQFRKLRLAENRRRLFRCSPYGLLPENRQKLRHFKKQLADSISHLLKTKRTNLTSYTSLLDSFSPRNVLKRGYSITFREATGAIVRDAGKVGIGENVRVMVAKGSLKCEVKKHAV